MAVVAEALARQPVPADLAAFTTVALAQQVLAALSSSFAVARSPIILVQPSPRTANRVALVAPKIQVTKVVVVPVGPPAAETLSSCLVVVPPTAEQFKLTAAPRKQGPLEVVIPVAPAALVVPVRSLARLKLQPFQGRRSFIAWLRDKLLEPIA